MQDLELFDTVNTADYVIGSTNKKEAHQKGYIHRVVAVYVFSSSGDLYVQKVGKEKLYDHSVGGHVVKGETYDSAAKRECYEELGISQSLQFLGKLYSDETQRHYNYRHMYAVYQTRVDIHWGFTPNKEVTDLECFNLQKILLLMKTKPRAFTTGFLNTMNYFLSIREKNSLPE
jgi:isopentenyl-diphosphate delta-isomerase